MIFKTFWHGIVWSMSKVPKKKKLCGTTIFVIVSESAKICLLKYLFKTKQN